MRPKTVGGTSLNILPRENKLILFLYVFVGIEFFYALPKFQEVKTKMSEAIIAKKAQLVTEVAEQFKNASSVVVVDYLGITVEEATNLRAELRKAGVQFAVVKNSILSRAAKEAGLEGMDDIFKGPSAVAFSNEDVVAPAKILADFAKKVEALEIKAGVVEGKVSSKEEIEALAKLPSREGLLSMLLSVLQAPVRNTALAIKAVADQKDGAAA